MSFDAWCLICNAPDPGCAHIRSACPERECVLGIAADSHGHHAGLLMHERADGSLWQEARSSTPVTCRVMTTPTHITGPDLIKWRHAAGLTQMQLADLIGVSLRTIGNWELSKTRIHPKHYADLLGVLPEISGNEQAASTEGDERMTDPQPPTQHLNKFFFDRPQRVVFTLGEEYRYGDRSYTLIMSTLDPITGNITLELADLLEVSA